MRKLLCIMLLLSSSAFGAEVTLQWDANSPEENVQGYTIYARDYTHGYNYEMPACAVSDTTCTITVPNDRQTAFVCRAWNYGVYDLSGKRTVQWSPNSDEIIFTPESPLPQKPANPLIRIIVAVLDFFVKSSGGFFS